MVGLGAWGAWGKYHFSSMVTGHKRGPASALGPHQSPAWDTDRPSSVLGARDPSLEGCRGKHEVTARACVQMCEMALVAGQGPWGGEGPCWQRPRPCPAA